ncbi:MAG TPA: hypothetical protein VMT95_11765 [Candidatus Binatia bacterium]|nr:hypothetical protein [Candidatus Binatia bacterium]
MNIARPSLTLAVSLALVPIGVAACHGAAPDGVVPAQTAQSRGAGLAARLPREILYAATLDWNAGTGTVYYYDAYGRKTSALGSLAIAQGYPNGLWHDGKGNVYVAVVNAGSNGRGYVNVYTPGLRKLLRTYSSGIDGPSGGAFDRAGNMYVSNVCGMAPSISCYVFAKPRRGHSGQGGSTAGYVAIFPLGSTQPSSDLQGPINIAVGVALDARQNVFVPNNTGGYAWNVVEFPAGSKAGKVLTFLHVPKNRWVGAATVDSKDALVASVNSAIDFFPRDHGRPAHSLTNGVLAADGLDYGPDGTLFAGNYEFESNEGNVIAFPPGASTPARSFAVPYGNGVISVTVAPR